MDRSFKEGIRFENLNLSIKPMEKGNYEDCEFLNCDFSQSDISAIIFSDCTFRECNLSLAKLILTVFKNVKFKNCTLMGLHFDDCNQNLLSFGFETESQSFLLL